jgi:hypothetical protein
MASSEEWARRQLEEANTIYEPDEHDGTFQLGVLIVWAAEMALAWGLASLVQHWRSG